MNFYARAIILPNLHFLIHSEEMMENAWRQFLITTQM